MSQSWNFREEQSSAFQRLGESGEGVEEADHYLRNYIQMGKAVLYYCVVGNDWQKL